MPKDVGGLRSFRLIQLWFWLLLTARFVLKGYAGGERGRMRSTAAGIALSTESGDGTDRDMM